MKKEDVFACYGILLCKVLPAVLTVSVVLMVAIAIAGFAFEASLRYGDPEQWALAKGFTPEGAKMFALAYKDAKANGELPVTAVEWANDRPSDVEVLAEGQGTTVQTAAWIASRRHKQEERAYFQRRDDVLRHARAGEYLSDEERRRWISDILTDREREKSAASP